MTAEFDTFLMPQPRLAWNERGEPVSTQYDDCYFSREDGIAESEYVFIRGNGFPEAWKESSRTVIAELGFGTGLNFLTTLKKWRETRTAGSELFYLSFEGYPLEDQDFRTALSRWPTVQNLSEELLAQLPSRTRGLHLLSFSGNVRLFLFYLPVLAGLNQASFTADAWYFDGFAPQRNPEMWSDEVFAEVARLSRPQSTFATFSVASAIRHSLEQVGFSVEKIQGFGKKREMLRGRFQHGSQVAVSKRRSQRVVVIGGGLAGTATAHACAKRGLEVLLLEREEKIAQGASGNSAGVIMPQLSVKPDLMSRFYLAGYFHALSSLKQDFSGLFHETGVLRLITSDRLRKVYASLEALGLGAKVAQALDAKSASDLLQLHVNEDAIYFSQGGWISPPRLASKLIEAGVRTCCYQEAIGLQRSSAGWVVSCNDKQIYEADSVIFCGAYEAVRFGELYWLPLENVRGQVMEVESSECSQTLKHVVCYDGYIIPHQGSRHLVGATFDHINDSREVSEEQNEALLLTLERWLPELGNLKTLPRSSRISFRAMSRDRLPMCGPVAELERFSALRTEVLRGAWEHLGLTDGLYVNVGHGSRGLSSCLLAAEVIAAELMDEPLPLERDLYRAIHPSRFLARILGREQTLRREHLMELKVPHLR